MPLILSLLSLFFMTQFSFADENLLMEKIQDLERLQKYVSELCLEGKNTDKVRVNIDGVDYTCAHLIALAERFKNEVDKEVEEFKMACEAPNNDLNEFAYETVGLAKDSASCAPLAEGESCLSKFTCGAMAVFPPISISMKVASKVGSSKILKECAEQAKGVPSCLTNVLRGIFDAIWTSIKNIWNIGKWIGNKIGLLKESEDATSERLMLATQSSPSFVDQLTKDPIKTIQTLGKNIFSSLEESAINHYGCEKWSGIPFTSTCLQPMTTWKCGTCQQKAQVYCGILGYASGEIVTSFLTGGLLAAGKVAIKGAVHLGTGPAGKVSTFMGKNFPKTTATISAATNKVQTMAKVGLTASQAKLLLTWTKFKESTLTKTISKAAGKAGQSVVGKIASIALKPISLYISAINKASNRGFEFVEKISSSPAKKILRKEALAGAKIADEVMNEANQKMGLIVKTQAPANVKVLAAKQIETTSSSRLVPAKKGPPVNVPKKDEKIVTRTSGEDLVVKYKLDPEYNQLFKGPEIYQGHHKELSLVIESMEKAAPQMSKGEIGRKIQSTLNKCEL